MVVGKRQRNWVKGLPILAGIWLATAVVDRLWFAIDHSMPAWDQAEYLTGCLNYWHAIQHPHVLSIDWWKSIWLLSSKIPPFTYIATAPFLQLFGTGADQTTLINLAFSAILLLSVYGLGSCLFTWQIGLWAAGLCLLFPGFYHARLDFLLDYPLTAMVTLAFWCLTLWRQQGQGKTATRKQQGTGRRLQGTETQEAVPLQSPWLSRWHKSRLGVLSSGFSTATLRSGGWAAAFGITFGLALMVKQPALLFLLIPLLWTGAEAIWQRAWGRLAQWFGALLLSLLVIFPWYRTNWLLMLTAGKRATIDSAIAEGDPPLHTLQAWTFYLQDLPHMVSWPLLLVPIVGFLLFWKRAVVSLQPVEDNDYSFFRVAGDRPSKIRQAFHWLGIFFLGAYFLSCLNINKDSRYILPYLPAVALFLACGLALLPRRWQWVRWGTVSLATLLFWVNLSPIAMSLSLPLVNARTRHPAETNTHWPHADLIAEVVRTEPFLRSTLGVLPSTAAINQHNLNYFGALRNFQVYGRQIGARSRQVNQDIKTLNWFVTKTGAQGSIRQQAAQAATMQVIQQHPRINLQKTWQLPDGSQLRLYHKQQPSVEVTPFTGTAPQRVRLEQVLLPAQAAAGAPVAVTYQWVGSWSQLQFGLVVLTWRRQTNGTNPAIAGRWLHDHAIALGNLHTSQSTRDQLNAGFRVTERLAMLPPPTAQGLYRLEATYLNQQTGESYAISAPAVTLNVANTSQAAVPGSLPELDWLTQFRALAPTLAQGLPALESVFDQVGRFNQYDPIQDYLNQVRYTLEYRLKQEPKNLQFAYAVALSQVLKRQVDPAIAALQRVIQLDPRNPNNYAYLAFVNLYDFRPRAAEAALKIALELNPNQPELKGLSAIAAFMQGHFMQAWRDGQIFLRQAS